MMLHAKARCSSTCALRINIVSNCSWINFITKIVKELLHHFFLIFNLGAFYWINLIAT